jgi:uncharacterized membrane protein
VSERFFDFIYRVVDRLRRIHPAAWLTFVFAAGFALLFGSLGVMNQRNFGTWSYDMGIYDQGFWLVSRGHQFMTVRGMNFWGHHFNLIAFAFAPFYWLGAGPEFLYVVQAIFLAAAAFPIYLIARDKFRTPWMGLIFALVYLAYAPVQWISWSMFHPEALVIAPFLWAWWFATRERWGWFFAMVLLALSMREDVAMAVVMLGIVLAIYMRKAPDYRRVLWRCAWTVVLGAVWYVIATRLVLNYFNDGKEPFYITYFYGNYGHSVGQIGKTILQNPDRVISDAVQHDRIKFYKQLGWPLAWLPLLNPLALLMALPQMLASVIGLSPYARMINYQYTSVMIAPLMISSIHGGHTLWRFRPARTLLPIALLLCAWMVALADRAGRQLLRVEPAEPAPRVVARGADVHPGRRGGVGQLPIAAPPGPSLRDLRLAQPVLRERVGQRRLRPPARPAHGRLRDPRQDPDRCEQPRDLRRDARRGRPVHGRVRGRERGGAQAGGNELRGRRATASKFLPSAGAATRFWMNRLSGTTSESNTFDEPARKVGTLSTRYMRKYGTTPATSMYFASTSSSPACSTTDCSRSRS